MSEGFLGRWSRRKLEVKQEELGRRALERGVQRPNEQPNDQTRSQNEYKSLSHNLGRTPGTAAIAGASAGVSVNPVSQVANNLEPGVEPKSGSQALPLPTEADIEAVINGGEIRSFMNPQVSGDLRNKAFKALFSQPQFNQMDFMDVYVDDYSVSAPLTSAMIDMMALGKQLLSRPDLEALKEVKAEDVNTNEHQAHRQGVQAQSVTENAIDREDKQVGVDDDSDPNHLLIMDKSQCPDNPDSDK